MPNLNVTLSQPHVEDRMKKVLMVEETMDTPNHHIFLYGIQNDSPLACILFAYYFKQIASELHQDCTTLLLIYKYRSGVKEKKGRGSFEETRGSMVQICDICSSVSFKRKSDKTSSSSIELSNQLFFLFTLTSRIFQDLNFVRIMSRLPEKIAGILFLVQLL